MICISAVISTCGQGRQWQVALGLLHQAKASSEVCCAVGGWLRRNVNPARRRRHQSLDSMFGVPTLAKKIDIQFNPQLQYQHSSLQRAHCEFMLRGEPVFCSWILYCSLLWDCSWTPLFSWISPKWSAFYDSAGVSRCHLFQRCYFSLWKSWRMANGCGAFERDGGHYTLLDLQWARVIERVQSVAACTSGAFSNIQKNWTCLHPYHHQRHSSQKWWFNAG